MMTPWSPQSVLTGHGRPRWLWGWCLLVALVAVAAIPSAAVAGPWSQVTRPWSTDAIVTDIAAFGSHGLVAVGTRGRIGVSHDGGDTWTVTVPTGYSSTVFTAVAFNGAGDGVVATGGQILVTHDGGGAWSPAAFAGAGPGAAVNDVAMRGDHAVAVGDRGVICASDDGGITWSRLDSPTTADLSAIAITGDGVAVIGGVSGEVLTGSGTAYSVVAWAGAPITAVAAAPDPTWGDGLPDLLASTGVTALASDDGTTFTAVANYPGTDTAPCPELTWVGRPGRTIMVCGDAAAAFLSTLTGGWLPTSTGLTGVTGVTAPGEQSVAYALGDEGVVTRTLSAGREPAATTLSARTVRTGARVRYTVLLNIAAPGRVLLQKRIVGRDWVTAEAATWSSGGWRQTLTLSFRPKLTTECRVRFVYGGAPLTVASAARVQAKPRLTPERGRYDLAVGDVYRFSGTVSPRLEGEKVTLYTDRGGSWRPVDGQRSVALVDGRRWTSRRFGTPKAETYHLRAYIARTARHAAAWSRAVTVSIH